MERSLLIGDTRISKDGGRVLFIVVVTIMTQKISEQEEKTPQKLTRGAKIAHSSIKRGGAAFMGESERESSTIIAGIVTELEYSVYDNLQRRLIKATPFG